MRRLGDYTLTRRLGVGGMGEVWMGRREALGGAARDVAIKLLSAERADNVEARRMFLDEARLSMLLRNSNIVQVHDVAEADDKTCYMVLEYVEGLDLADLSDRMRAAGEEMPDAIIAFIIGEVLKGLAHAHDLRSGGERKVIVHRDISPHNVMLSVFGEVKIMDFGIARMASEDTSGVHVKGKLRYMPPEQLRGETREPSLDLFAVGAMLHELLDGVKFRSNVIDEGRLFGMILDGELPPMKRSAGTIPKQLDELRLGLLAAKPDDRLSSARAAFKLLTTWPGYRDTRFELDELVRRYLGEPHAAAAGPATSVLPHPSEELPREGETGADGTLIVPPPVAVETATDATIVLPPPEGSETDVSRVRDSGTGTAVERRQGPIPGSSGPATSGRTKIIAGAFGLVGLGFALFGVTVMLEGRDADGTALAQGESPPVEDVAEPSAVEPEPKVEAEPAVEPEAEPVVEDEPVVDEPEPVIEDEPAIEPEPESSDEIEDEAAAPGPVKPDRPAVSTTKVTMALGAGVAWGEIKIGSRTFELDAFSGKGATTRLKPGGYNVSARTQVGGAWKKAGRVTIPDGAVTVRLEKNGSVKVE